MTEITTSFPDTLGNLAKEFVKSTPAAALFYNKDGSGMGLRIESVELMKEFSTGVEFGRGRFNPFTLLDWVFNVF